jgi:hypothetical protein
MLRFKQQSDFLTELRCRRSRRWTKFRFGFGSDLYHTSKHTYCRNCDYRRPRYLLCQFCLYDHWLSSLCLDEFDWSRQYLSQFECHFGERRLCSRSRRKPDVCLKRLVDLHCKTASRSFLLKLLWRMQSNLWIDWLLWRELISIPRWWRLS